MISLMRIIPLSFLGKALIVFNIVYALLIFLAADLAACFVIIKKLSDGKAGEQIVSGGLELISAALLPIH